MNLKVGDRVRLPHRWSSGAVGEVTLLSWDRSLFYIVWSDSFKGWASEKDLVKVQNGLDVILELLP